MMTDEEIRQCCMIHPECFRRIDERHIESWDRQLSINHEFAVSMKAIELRTEQYRIETIQSISKMGATLAKVLGGIAGAGFLLTIVANFLLGYIHR